MINTNKPNSYSKESKTLKYEEFISEATERMTKDKWQADAEKYAKSRK